MTHSLTSTLLESNGRQATGDLYAGLQLIRLLPEQVEKAWDILAPMFAQAMPPTQRVQRYALTNILRAVLLEEAVCWAWLVDGKLSAVMLTTEHMDVIMQQRALLIYCLFALEDQTKEIWMEGIEVLRHHARELGYKSIVAFVQEPAVARLVRQFGASPNITFINIGI